MKGIIKKLFLSLALIFIFQALNAQHSVAREWNELLLESIRKDLARPTVHARNLWHASIALYDAWAVYDDQSVPFLLGNTVDSYYCKWDGIPIPIDIEGAREEAMSFAIYRLLRHRFMNSDAAIIMFPLYDTFMSSKGYNINVTSTDYSGGSAAAVGNYIGQELIAFGLQDYGNEQIDYGNTHYVPVNDPMVMETPGNPDIDDLNRWQPLTLEVFIDQSGNIIPLSTPEFLSPEWGQVSAFALKDDDKTTYLRDGFEYEVFHDPGPPPYIDTLNGAGTSDDYKWAFSLVSQWSSHLDTSDHVMWDISPASIGNIQSYPTTVAGMKEFYNSVDGGDPSIGHPINPTTGIPYTPQIVHRGDYTRVLAEFWADGPDSETPPGHWFTLLNYVSDNELLLKQYEGKGEILDDLEWDVKAYFTLAGAMHDAAVTSWGCKGWYDYIRPVSALRAMAEFGQSSEPQGTSYHIAGVPIIPGFIEVVKPGDPLAGPGNINAGKIKFFAWKGPEFIVDPDTDQAGVAWILAENWFPYQRPTFVTPPFAGYVSGHSTFSRAAAEVMTMLTGDPFFPGGMGEFVAPQNDFLVFEEGPSETIKLQWATYRDASDQCSLSRIWGGIHPPVDDIPGRLMGIEVGVDAFLKAKEFIAGTICEGTINVNVDPIPAGTYMAKHIINSSGRIENGSVVKFNTLGEINLNPGFNIELNSLFTTAQIGCN